MDQKIYYLKKIFYIFATGFYYSETNSSKLKYNILNHLFNNLNKSYQLKLYIYEQEKDIVQDIIELLGGSEAGFHINDAHDGIIWKQSAYSLNSIEVIIENKLLTTDIIKNNKYIVKTIDDNNIHLVNNFILIDSAGIINISRTYSLPLMPYKFRFCYVQYSDYGAENDESFKYNLIGNVIYFAIWNDVNNMDKHNDLLITVDSNDVRFILSHHRETQSYRLLDNLNERCVEYYNRNNIIFN